jgi:hypothetical protein
MVEAETDGNWGPLIYEIDDDETRRLDFSLPHTTSSLGGAR